MIIYHDLRFALLLSHEIRLLLPHRLEDALLGGRRLLRLMNRLQGLVLGSIGSCLVKEIGTASFLLAAVYLLE